MTEDHPAATAAAPPTDALAPIDRHPVAKVLAPVSAALRAALQGSPIDFARFAVAVRSAVIATPALLQCDPDSFRGAVLRCAMLGLLPEPEIGHFSLAPFGREVVPIPSKLGYLELATRAGTIEPGSLRVRFLYPEDRKHLVEHGIEEVFDEAAGKFNLPPIDPLADRDDADIVGATAICRVVDVRGPRWVSLTMTRARIEKRRNFGGKKGQDNNSPAWRHWWREMADKTVAKALLRSGRVPYGTQQQAFAQVVALDQQADDGEGAA